MYAHVVRSMRTHRWHEHPTYGLVPKPRPKAWHNAD